MSDRPRNQCWYEGCPNRIEVNVLIKLRHGNAMETREMRGCRDHIMPVWLTYSKHIGEFCDPDSCVHCKGPQGVHRAGDLACGPFDDPGEKAKYNRVVMNRDNTTVRQAITPYDVLSVKQVRDLAAWLNRYLHMVAPTEQGAVIANARAHARGIDRGLTNLEAAQTRGAGAK